MVFDSGILISLLQGELEWLYRRVRDETIDPLINVVNLTEVYYVLRRKVGAESAGRIMDDILRSGYFKVVGVSREVSKEASLCKCRYPISLPDCFSIATAKVHNTKALFRREKELEGIKDQFVEFVD